MTTEFVESETVDPAAREPLRYPFAPPERLDVHPTYGELRSSDGLVMVQPQFGGTAYLATRYDDVRQVLSDPRLSRAAAVGENEPRNHPFVTPPEALSALDPPEHTRLRRVLMGALTARRMEALRPRVQQIVDEALDEVARRGPGADLVELLAVVVPGTVISELLGVPVADRAQFKAWAEVILTAETGRSPEEVFTAYQQLGMYLAGRLEQRRREPAEDLLSWLVAARDVHDTLSDMEMVGLATTVLVAGYETTVNQLASICYVLLTHPDTWVQLRNDPALVPQAVEELLRVAPVLAAAGFARVATEDLELGGIVIKAGEAVLPAHFSANLDDRVYPNPEEIDFTRRNTNAHVAFSHGPHHCPGAQLARVELQVAIASLVARFPNLRLASHATDVPWKQSALARGPLALRVTWD